MSTATRSPAHVVSCNRCPWRDSATTARAHEADNPGHRVTVWADATSQLPPALWPTQEPR